MNHLSTGNLPLPARSNRGRPFDVPLPVSPLLEQHKQQRREQQLRRLRPARPRLPGRLKPVLAAAAAFGLLLIAFKFPVIATQLSYATRPEPPPVVSAPVATVQAVAADPIIQIPKIGVTAPVIYEPSVAESKIQKALQNGVVHYGNTPKPGEPGNSVIVGHSSNDWWEPGNYKFVFVLLDKLVIGDTFSVNYEGRQYVYKVSQVKIVEPTDLSVLRATAEPSLTLITCTPPGTSWKRLIVRGTQISPSPATASTPAAVAVATPEAVLPGNAPDFLQQLSKVWQNLKRSLGIGAEEGADIAPPGATQPTLPGS